MLHKLHYKLVMEKELLLPIFNFCVNFFLLPFYYYAFRSILAPLISILDGLYITQVFFFICVISENEPK